MKKHTSGDKQVRNKLARTSASPPNLPLPTRSAVALASPYVCGPYHENVNFFIQDIRDAIRGLSR